MYSGFQMKFHGVDILVLVIVNLIFLSLVYSTTTNEVNICKSEYYQNRTLKLLREQVVADSFIDYSKYKEVSEIPNRFEASDVVLRSDGQVMYIVFDNIFQIGAFCTPSAVHTRNCVDEILNWPNESMHHLESQFEGITYNSLHDTYFIVQEAIPTIGDPKKFQPNIYEIYIGKNKSSSYVQIIDSCRVQMEFESDSKGFEGLEFVVHQKTGQTYLFGLCEANKCASSIMKQKKETDLGDGRIVLLERKEATKKNPCIWKVADMINLPSTVQFLDYSAISIYRGNSSVLPTYVAITSQENSELWIGRIEELDNSPFFRISSLKKDVMYNLPRLTELPKDCLIKYCNVEGVAWRGKNQLILVSDKAKKQQDAICNDKDQAIHYVTLPDTLSN